MPGGSSITAPRGGRAVRIVTSKPRSRNSSAQVRRMPDAAETSGPNMRVAMTTLIASEPGLDRTRPGGLDACPRVYGGGFGGCDAARGTLSLD
jgi:hypothetical protein